MEPHVQGSGVRGRKGYLSSSALSPPASSITVSTNLYLDVVYRFATRLGTVLSKVAKQAKCVSGAKTLCLEAVIIFAACFTTLPGLPFLFQSFLLIRLPAVGFPTKNNVPTDGDTSVVCFLELSQRPPAGEDECTHIVVHHWNLASRISSLTCAVKSSTSAPVSSPDKTTRFLNVSMTPLWKALAV